MASKYQNNLKAKSLHQNTVRGKLKTVTNGLFSLFLLFSLLIALPSTAVWYILVNFSGLDKFNSFFYPLLFSLLVSFIICLFMLVIKLMLQSDLKIKNIPFIKSLFNQPLLGNFLKAGLSAIAILAVVVGFFLFQNKAEIATAAWWNDNWSYRKAIVINHQYVEADLTNFPVLISFTDSNLSNHAQEDGDDFIFVNTEGKKLAHEIEKYASSTGELVAWVKIPSLSSADDTPIYMYYGNAGIGNQQDAENVWSNNFLAVWHMEESSGTLYDSTDNNYDMSAYGSPSYQQTGNIGYGILFDDSTSDYFQRDEILPFDTPLTITAWYNDDDALNDNDRDIVQVGDKDVDDNYFRLSRSDNEGGPELYALTNDGTVEWAETNGYYTGDIWNYGTAIFVSSTERKVYINVSNVGTDSAVCSPTGLDRLNIGYEGDSSPGDEWSGLLDEVRIASVERSVNWLQTEYTNQASTTLFLSPQAEEIGPGPVGYWTFDTGYGSTAYDQSGQGNDGTITGASWQDESMCVSGKCLWFDGTGDYAEMPDNNSLDLEEFSISAWVKGNSFPTDSINEIVSKADDNFEKNANYRLMWNGYSDQRSFYFVIGDSSTIYNAEYKNPKENTWYHLVGVYNRSRVLLYVNGVEYPGSIFSGSPVVSSNPVRIGESSWDHEQQWDGFIDEVKIYPYARSADEIKQDYIAGLAGVGTRHGVSVAFGGESEKWMTDGLVGYWQMDESATTSGAFDLSGNGNDGTYYGDASTTAGKFGNGGIFDGTDSYLGVSDSNELDITGVITVAAWIKGDAFGSGNDEDRIVLKGPGPNTGNLYTLEVDDGEVRFILHNTNLDDTVCTANQKCVRGDLNLSTDTWYHLVGTYDGSDMKTYVNGSGDGSKYIGPLTGTPNGDPVIVGGRTDSADMFDGTIDEVRIYNRALSPREVRKLYEWAPGPVAHWRFDEKTGTTAYDSAASTTFSGGNHGTLGGGTPAYRPTWTRGKYGSALEFDGSDDYVNIGNTSNLNITGGITLSAWVYMVDSESGGIVSKMSGATGLGSYGIWVYNGTPGITKPRFRLDTGSAKIVGTSEQPINQWFHFAGTYDGNEMRTYTNGILDDKQSVTGNISTSTYSLDIGRMQPSHYYAKSLIDDVRIYNYALNQKQIINVMNGRKVWESAVGSPVGSAMLHLKFDEGYGATAYDSSPQENNGTLYPGTTGDNQATSSMWDLNGKFGRAIEFDGQDDWVNCGDVLDMGIDDFTLTGWYKTSDTGQSAVVSKMGGYNNANTYGVFLNTGGKLTATFRDSAASGGMVEYTISTADGTWHHVTAVYDRDGDLTLYLDRQSVGAPLDISSSNGNSLNTSRHLRVGHRDLIPGDNMEFNGLIDDVRIYNFALNEDEIKLVYNQGMAAVMGSVSTATTTAGTHVPSWSASREYCVPGSDDYCAPPVLEYRFDEKQGTTAYNTGEEGNDGSFSSSPTWKGSGYCRIGNCLEFDGDNDYVYSANDGFTSGYNFSYTFWMKAHALPAGAGIVSIGSTPTDGVPRMLVQTQPNAVRLYHRDAWTTTYAINTDLWYHMAAIWDNTYATLYIDGIQRLQGTIQDGGGYGDTYYMGSGYNGYFNGLLDNVRIYDYALTQSQIAWDYNKGKPIAHWRFDECSGGTIYDESRRCIDGASCNHGTLHLGTSGVTATGTCASSSNSFWYNGSGGKHKAAGMFDGSDDYISVGDTGMDINVVSFWWTGNYASSSIVDLDGGAHTVTITNGQISANGFSSPIIYVNGLANSSVADRGWHHILITTDTAIDANNVSIGQADSDYFNGFLDDFKMFNYTLTLEQVKTDYSSAAISLGSDSGWTCGSSKLTDIDGNSYNTVLIGAQCWMSENMRTTTYPDGSPITKGCEGHTGCDGTGDLLWGNDTALYSCPPNAANNGQDCDAAASLGMLYQWSAAMASSTSNPASAGDQGICPDGWHVPTDNQQHILDDYLDDGTSCIAGRAGYGCDPAGSKLADDADDANWTDDALNNPPYFDMSGFNAPPSGYRFTDGNYGGRADGAFLWSSSEAGANVWYRTLSYNNVGVIRSDCSKAGGISVRCLKD